MDQSFTSSPSTFNDVEDASTIQFPARDPSPGQLATRLDRELPRLSAALRRADERADAARTLAIVAVVVGALGLLAAAAALVALKRVRGLPGGGEAEGKSASRQPAAGPMRP